MHFTTRSSWQPVFFLATLFLIFGWRKVRDYSGTVSQMVQDGLPSGARLGLVGRAFAYSKFQIR